MKIITAEEMRRIDRASSVDPETLMERAGKGLADFIRFKLPRIPVCFICGRGNNGGDGFVAARYLKEKGFDVDIRLAGDPGKLSGLPGTQAAKLSIPVRGITDPSELKEVLKTPSIAVDCLFGTGFRPPLDSYSRGILEIINKNSKITLACDIPSGVNGDSGDADGGAVSADITLSFEFPKIGHLLGPGAELTGTLEIAGIGTGVSPEKFFQEAELTVPGDIDFYFRRRKRDTHKKVFGHVLVLGGSPGMAGAPGMAVLGALRAGAGLVTCAAGKSVAEAAAGWAASSMQLHLEENPDGSIKSGSAGMISGYAGRRNVDCLLIGPGLGAGKEQSELVKRVIEGSGSPVLIDADGLNALSGRLELLRECRQPVLLTPHPGEFERIAGYGCGKSLPERIKAARDLSERTGSAVLLKGYRSIIASEGEVFINPTGGPALAAGGSGDVLAGICGALMGQGVTPFDAARAGAWVHGRAGDISAWHTNERYVLPEDILNNLWRV